MGIISRHPGAPFSSGETLDGTADLEVDINNIVTEVNGNLNDANISALSGDKITSGTIPRAALTNTANGNVQRANNTGAVTTSTSYIDLASITGITLTPASSADIIMLHLMVHMNVLYDTVFGFSIGGTEYDAGYIGTTGLQAAQTFWAMPAGSVSSLLCKPRAKRGTAGGDNGYNTGSPALDYNTLFMAWLIPATS